MRFFSTWSNLNMSIIKIIIIIDCSGSSDNRKQGWPLGGNQLEDKCLGDSVAGRAILIPGLLSKGVHLCSVSNAVPLIVWKEQLFKSC